jgi:tetratricopeptide (TPR) repeat protein
MSPARSPFISPIHLVQDSTVRKFSFSAARPLSVNRHRSKLAALALLIGASPLFAEPPFHEPVVARVEMKLAAGEELVDVIEQGDLLTVLEEREKDYVILTHDGSKGAVDKNNAVRIIESESIYTDLIERNPNEGRYYTLRASAWWAQQKAERALEDFDKAIELGYKEAHAYTSRGLFHAEMGNYDKAIADYDEALKINPEDLAPVINRAAVHMSRGNYLKAAEDYTLVLKVKEKSSSILHQRAIAYKSAGKLAEAAADFSAILEINDKDYQAVMGRGYVHFQQKQYSDAVTDFARAIELNPQDAVAWNNRGYNLYQNGQFAEALSDYDKAIELAPKYALAYQNRAWLLATASDPKVIDSAAAVVSAKQACELTNYNAVGDLSALAAALAADKKFDEAVGWQEKVVNLVAEPYKEFAKKTLARYEAERPFAADPDKANAEEQAAAETEGKQKQQAKAAEDATESEPKA